VNVLRGSAAFAAPAVILAAAYALSVNAPTLLTAHPVLAAQAPVVVLALAAALAIAFQRGRVFFAVVTLAVAWFAYRGYISRGVPGLPPRAAFAALCVFVPLNLALLALTRERGIVNRHGLARVAVLFFEFVVTAWLLMPGNRDLLLWLYQPLTAAAPSVARVAHAGLILMVVGVAAGIGKWWFSRSAIDLALAGAVVAWGLATLGIGRGETVIAFTAAAALMLVVAMLQDVYRMAFRDELTGLPARRALNEHLARLGRRYVIAVIDIDHFKKFNDTHGHDVGDQVLKMAATRIERVRGGGSAYRFGGEEFVIVFPRAGVSQVMAHLEALRIDVAQHGLMLRASERTPASPSTRSGSRKPPAAGKKLSVTISIGVAECSDKQATPADVLTAADKALYRAKRAGRNRISR
jgi:diguanylate cyclase (GGDEF)-like protein